MSMTSTTTIIPDELEYGGPHHWQIQPWARLARKALRQREYLRWVDQYCTSVSVKGAEHLEALDGPAIFIANHQSHMDTPVFMQAMPEKIRNNLYFGAAADRWFVKGKKKLILQPWYQSLAMGNFPIVRGGGSRTLDYAKWLLDHNCNICIFPEGTRATDGKLGQFRHGVSLLALEKRVPVVPVLLKGLRELRPKGSREVTPGPVSVSILEPVHLTRDSGMGVEASTQLLWERMNREFFESIPFPGRNESSQEDATPRKDAA
ncbi:MAG: lysophospholipid acyltransferase family protein [Proteobacteria bacterium]|nr:lysophospholipid acyltransferase family protein [Pseudomonadota bacterium]